MKSKLAILLFLIVPGLVFAFDVSFNFSLIPADEGSGTQTSVLVNWMENFSSRINIREARNKVLTEDIAGYGDLSLQSVATKNFQIDILPLERDWKFSTLTGSFSAGGSYLSLDEKQLAIFDDINGNLDEPAGQTIAYKNIRTAHLFSPRVGLTFNYPVIDNFRIRYKGFLSPVYFISLKQEINYSYLTKAATNTVERWSSPYLEHDFFIQYSEWLRIAAYHTYQRLDFQTMDWNDDADTFVGVDDIQQIHEFKVGVEPLLNIKAGLINLKLGLYWQGNWFQSSYWKMDNFEQKFSIAFGTEGGKR